jgi:hypothetical protein
VTSFFNDERNGGYSMSFKLHVAFSGLFDFIPNQDQDTKKVRLCVVLPTAPNHNARISALPTSRLRLNGVMVDEEISFDNMRVSLRLKKTKGTTDPGPLNYKAPMIDGPVYGVIPFEMIAGPRANDTNPVVVSGSASAAVSVRAQILIEEGNFALDMPNGAAKLLLPKTLTGHQKTIKIAPRTYMTIDNVESAQIVTSPLSSSPDQEVAYDISDDGGGEASILLSYLCTDTIFSAFQKNSDDDDFRFHYRLLLSPPQTQTVKPWQAPPTPVPEVVSLPSVPEANTAPVATSGAFKSMKETDDIPGGPKGFQLLSLSVGGCNCAGNGGKPVAFDLDDFVAKPLSASVAPSSLTSSPG